MSGLAKTAEEVKPVEPVVHAEGAKLTSSEGEFNYLGVPVDMFRYFNLDLGKASSSKLEKVDYINGWLKESNESVGDRLMELRKIENKIGMSGMDSRIDKVWQYMRLSKNMKEMEKKMKAMEQRGGDW